MLDKILGAGDKTASGKGPSFVCKGMVTSAQVNGEADISVSDEDFALAALFDSTRVPWPDVTALKYEDYAVYVQTKTGNYVFSKLGQRGEQLYSHMLAAYNDKVRKCLFVSGSPDKKAKGEINIGGSVTAGVPVEVYEDCILSLPPNLLAKRVPLCFVTGLKDEDFKLAVSAMDGAYVVYSKLGYEHDPVSKAIQNSIKLLRARLIDQLSEIDPSLSDAQASQLVKLMPGGLTAPMGAIRSIAPSFVDALESMIAESRASETYKVFQDISGPDEICVGFRANDKSYASGKDEGGIPGGVGAMSEVFGGAIGKAAHIEDLALNVPDPYMLLLVAPAPTGGACALEFAGTPGQAAATFVYRFNGAWNDFRIKLGIALEAIAWKREIIRFTEAELAKPENANHMMANDRNEALRFVRASFAGRVTHQSLDSWKAQVTKLLGL